MHEMGLLFYHFLSRKAGYRTYYLGQNVPHEDVVNVFAIHEPDLLLTSITAPQPAPIDIYLNKLAAAFPTTPILASGYQLQRYKGLKIGNIQVFSTALELKDYL